MFKYWYWNKIFLQQIYLFIIEDESLSLNVYLIINLKYTYRYQELLFILKGFNVFTYHKIPAWELQNLQTQYLFLLSSHIAVCSEFPMVAGRFFFSSYHLWCLKFSLPWIPYWNWIYLKVCYDLIIWSILKIFVNEGRDYSKAEKRGMLK